MVQLFYRRRVVTAEGQARYQVVDYSLSSMRIISISHSDDIHKTFETSCILSTCERPAGESDRLKAATPNVVVLASNNGWDELRGMDVSGASPDS